VATLSVVIEESYVKELVTSNHHVSFLSLSSQTSPSESTHTHKPLMMEVDERGDVLHVDAPELDRAGEALGEEVEVRGSVLKGAVRLDANKAGGRARVEGRLTGALVALPSACHTQHSNERTSGFHFLRG
jgi:hypothetical protein